MVISTAGDERTFGGWDSRRLWSLWDMINLDLSGLAHIAKELGRLMVILENSEPDDLLLPATQKGYRKAFKESRDLFRNLGLNLCAMQCSRMLVNLNISNRKISAQFAELFNRMNDECHLGRFISLTIKEAKYFDGEAPLFSAEVEGKFPSCAFEIQEAGKCLGLGRSTASVFHLMRTMEIGVRSLATCLGIPDPIKPVERNWGVILKSVSGAISAKWPKAEDRMGGDGKLFEELYASLDAVKNPWRNSTMHVESKFTDDEAEHILVAVKGFMKKLASRMDEKGEPKA